ncbi:hypothetical protein Q9233_016676 [Columba guinea]|nr:hypothetical protein Q9233_016676 [Columba guinea]
MHRPPEGVEGARITQMPSFKQLLKELRGRNAAMALHASSLDRLVESQAKVRIAVGAVSVVDLLALLQEHRPSTEGIFRLAAGERASRELREALDSGAWVQLESQPVHLLAAILKEFLCKIASKLLQNELYEDWMSALQKTSRQERLAGMKENQQSMAIQVQLAQLVFEVFQTRCHLFFMGKASLDTLSNHCPT